MPEWEKVASRRGLKEPSDINDLSGQTYPKPAIDSNGKNPDLANHLVEAELAAMRKAYRILRPLSWEAQQRVLTWLGRVVQSAQDDDRGIPF